jgi:L-ascorbate metabolism protein UlaG (beta-lactamase superfamily)
MRNLAIRAGIPLIIFSLFAYWRFLTSSADMSDYASFYVDDTTPSREGEVRVTFLGTTTLLLDDGVTQLMCDGFLTRPAMWRVALLEVATDKALVDGILARFNITRLKALFVSHSHYDHAFDVPYIVQRTGAVLYGSPSTINVGRGGGVPETQMVQFESGKELSFGDFRVTVVDSKHAPGIPFINDDIGETIDVPLIQPVRARAYHEGSTHDILVHHRGRAILVKSSANVLPGALDHVHADVLFLALMTLGKQRPAFRHQFYDESVRRVAPKLIVPVHWDDFFEPLSSHLTANKRAVDDLKTGLDFIISRAQSDGIAFRILQGGSTIRLFSAD